MKANLILVGRAAVAMLTCAAAFLVPQTDAHAYKLLGCKWGSSTVKWYVPSPLAVAPIWSNGASRWKGVDAKLSSLTSSGSAMILATSEARGNTVSWTGVARKKGTVSTAPTCSSGILAAGSVEVVINTTASGWSSASSDRKNGVAAHELGHALGLAHSTGTNVLMYPYYDVAPTTPQADDKNGINYLY